MLCMCMYIHQLGLDMYSIYLLCSDLNQVIYYTDITVYLLD